MISAQLQQIERTRRIHADMGPGVGNALANAGARGEVEHGGEPVRRKELRDCIAVFDIRLDKAEPVPPLKLL